MSGLEGRKGMLTCDSAGATVRIEDRDPKRALAKTWRYETGVPIAAIGFYGEREP